MSVSPSKFCDSSPTTPARTSRFGSGHSGVCRSSVREEIVMKRALWQSTIVIAAAIIIVVHARDRYREDYPEIQSEAIQKNLSFSQPSATKSLNVDNIEG